MFARSTSVLLMLSLLVERLLEDSWESRSQQAGRRELAVESLAAALFLGIATPLAVPALAAHRLDSGRAFLRIAL
jgi:hypothetical protein